MLAMAVDSIVFCLMISPLLLVKDELNQARLIALHQPVCPWKGSPRRSSDWFTHPFGYPIAPETVML